MGLEFTQYVDLAQVVLYLFWAFFAVLILYLHRESKREGYPLLTEENRPGLSIVGFPGMPPPKTYKLFHGGEVTVPAPDGRADARPLALARTAPWTGAPYVPTGDPMADGVGPASWAERADHPDLTVDGHDKIVPLRIASEFHVEANDPDPRGLPVVGADDVRAGVISDLWVDRAEFYFRYYEVKLDDGRTVLLPVTMARIEGRKKVKVRAILGSQFGGVPQLKSPDRITFLEEEKVSAYYGGGYLYATPARQEPIV
jgi:photosynthetic reaction center H subunit